MPEYTITSVGDPREWKNSHGRFYAYPLNLEDADGKTQVGVEWSRKTSSRAPETGERIVGDIKGGPHGDKLKVDLEATKALSGASPAGATSYRSREWQPESKYDPEKTARITRSHAQKVAVEAAVAAGYLDGEITDGVWRNLVSLIDRFEHDVNQAAQEAGGGAGSGGPRIGSLPAGRTPPAEAQDQAEYRHRLLEEAGFPSVQIPPVQRYIESEVSGERLTKLETALRSTDLTVGARAVDQLVAETEEWTGEKLPKPARDDDVPF